MRPIALLICLYYTTLVILNINKPKTWTSFDVVAKVRGVLKVKKAGHAGTLDPLAEGVLLVLTGDDTKKQDEYMHQVKEYVAEITFDIESPTYDLEMLPHIKKEINLSEIKPLVLKNLKQFEGDIIQTIPPFSAKKVNGKPMYKAARTGVVQEIQKKTVRVEKIEVLDSYDKEVKTDEGLKPLPTFKFRVTCSSGAFIRSLAHDFGALLGTGAVMTSLTRTKVGNFTLQDAVKIEDLPFLL